MQPTQDKIFVSYSRHDEAFARKMAIWLAKTLNVGVWIDIDDITPGIKWSAAIQDGLDHCEVMVVIITPESMESINVEDEWQYFIDLGKPVVPILVRSAPVPYQLRRIQWIDFSDQDEYNNSLRELVVELRKHLKPLSGEVSSAPALHRSHHGAVAQSKKAKRDRVTKDRTVQLLDRQERALKRNNTIIALMGVLLVLTLAGVGAFFAYLYFTQPDVFTVRGDTSGGLAILSNGTIEQLTAGEYTVGTVIRVGNSPIELVSESGQNQAVLQADSEVGVEGYSDESVSLEMQDGNVSLNTNGNEGRVTTPYGVDIESNDNIEVVVNQDEDEVQANCFEGNCTLTDSEDGRTLELAGGQSITFTGSERDFSAENIVDIPGSVAFVTNRHGASEIYLMRPDGTNQTRLTNNSGVRDESPAWSPDGSTIAYETTLEGTFNIALIPSTGGDVTLLTENAGNNTSPTWSPDGSLIAFASSRSGTNQIYIMEADGSNLIQITFESSNDSPTWSPDGTRMAFSSRRTGNDEIFVLDLTDPDAIPINLTNNPGVDVDPAWSPDGTMIAFTSNRTNDEEIYVIDMTLPDAEAVNISQSSGRDLDPTWSPDSTRVMFTSVRFGSLDIITAEVDNPNNVVRLTSEASTSDQEAAWLPIIRAGQ